MLGGTTYEESRAVALLNQRLASDGTGGAGGTRILLGGSTVHNSERYVLLGFWGRYADMAEQRTCSFLNMVEVCAENGDPRIYNPPSGLPPISASTSMNPSTQASPAAGSSSTMPSLNLRAGGYELSVGGSGGSGLFRTNQEAGANVQLGGQAAQVAEGIRDGAGRLWGNVRQKVEERVSRTGTPQGGR